jgi:phospholipid transport system substrate-binding protein
MPAFSQLRRAVSYLAAALLLMLPITLATAESASQTAAAPIEALDQALIGIMTAGRQTPFQKRADMLAPVIERGFDLPEILKISVGPGWSALSAGQQTALLAAFRRYTIASYVDNFDNYDGQRFVISPNSRPLSDGRQVVDTQIVPKTGKPHTLDYVMRKTDAGWKVVDVLADGSISRVALQRSDFSALFNKGGAPALEANLQEKTNALSRG